MGSEADRELFARLMAESERPVYAFLAGKVRDRGIASDVAQEAFFQAYRRFSSYDRSRPFLPWMMTIAYNCLVDYWRKFGRENADLPDEQYLAAPDTEHDDEWKQQEILQAMTHLSADDSELITMFYVEKHSLAEIGATLGISEGTAKVRLFRARAALRKRMEGPRAGGSV